jgi:hypothetical protein
MKLEMRRQLARLPYPEKLRRVAELIEFSREMKRTRRAPEPRRYSGAETAAMLAEDEASGAHFRAEH